MHIFYKMTKYLIIKMYQNILIYFIQSMLIVLSSILDIFIIRENLKLKNLMLQWVMSSKSLCMQVGMDN